MRIKCKHCKYWIKDSRLCELIEKKFNGDELCHLNWGAPKETTYFKQETLS